MSEIGNISKSYGKEVKIAIANTYSTNVLNSEQLPSQSIIISSPIDSQSMTDIGTYCMLATDVHGQPVRLTYTLQTGNGLIVDPNNSDIVKLDIDKSTLTTGSAGELKANTDLFIDNTTLVSDNDKLYVNTQGIPAANTDQIGVVSIDDDSLKITSNGNLYVDTENIDKANEYSVGVVTSDNETVDINTDGVISVNTGNLDKATQTNYGVVKIDNNTITNQDGTIHVETNNIQKCSTTKYGIVKPDNDIVKINNGTLYASTNSLPKASLTTYGTIKVDGISLISNNGILSVYQYDKIIETLNQFTNKLSDIEKTIDKLNRKIS